MYHRQFCNLATIVTVLLAIWSASPGQSQLLGIIPIMTPIDILNCSNQFQNAQQQPNPDIGLTIEHIITKYGYPVQQINVTSEDGYIIAVHRIPFSPKSPSGQVKKAVILSHGLGTNGQSWLIQYKNRNLAMLLADSGYDVFIINARGTKYSQGHIDPTLTPDNIDYWDFGFHEMGVYDIPAVIEKVTEVTGNWKMYYIGHSMGTTMIEVTLTSKPQYNERLHTVFLLAPAVHLGHATPFLRLIASGSNYYQYLLNPLVGGRIDTPQKISQLTGIPLGAICSTSALACGACGNLMFALFGYDAPQMNYTTLPLLLDVFPDTISTKTWIHLAQLVNTNQFCQFNYGFDSLNYAKYGSNSPPCYDLTKSTAPTVIYWGQNDILDVPQDAAQTASEIPGLKISNRVEWDLWTHLDFCMAKDADTLVYQKIVKTMDDETYE